MAGDNYHSPLSPSARSRWGACPGSVREEAKYPESGGGAAANDGTRTHALLEQAIRFEFVDKQGQCGPMPYIHSTITDEYGTYTVDAERCKRLNVALEYIRETVAEVGGTAVIPEMRVYPDGLVLRADMSGTVDVQIPGKDVYVIVDYKDGVSPVPAFENPQLEQYALGVLASLDQSKLPKKLRLVIVQPKLAMKGMPIISTWEITPAELLARVPVIIAQAAATDAPDAPLVPGETQCKYCRAKGSCAAVAGKVMTEVGLMFSPVPDAVNLALPVIEAEVIPPGVLDMAQQAAAKDPTKMNAAQLRQLMEAAPLVREFFKGVEAEVQTRLKAGQAVPGFKMVQGPGRRTWALPEDEIVKKLKGMGLPTETIYEKTLISPNKAENAVWDKKGETQKLSDTQIKRMNNEYVTKSAGGVLVVPESDSRPAIADASSLFTPVEPAAVPLPPFLGGPAAPLPVEAPPLPPMPALPDWLK